MRVLNEPSCYHLRALDPVFRFEEITAGGGCAVFVSGLVCQSS